MLTSDDTSDRFAQIELDGPTPDMTTINAKLIEMGFTVPANDTSDDLPVVTLTREDLRTQSAPPMDIIPGTLVSQSGVRRAMADEAEAVKQGFSLKPPVYQLGRPVNSIGEDNFGKARVTWDAKHLLGEGCEKIINLVLGEKRSDIQVDVPDLSMAPNGDLIVPSVGPLPMTKRAIEGMTHFVASSGGRYLSEITPALRAVNFNAHFPLAYRVDKRAKTAEDSYTPKRVTVRTRTNAEGNRETYSVVGPRYTAFDTNQVVSQVYNALVNKGLDARVDVTYDGYKLRMDVLFHTNVQPSMCVAGEIFSAGLCIRTADDGTGSINVSVELERNLCLNMIILDSDKILVGRSRHSGKTKTIAEKIDEALATASTKIEYFAKAWDAGTLENVTERYNLGDPREVFRGLVLNGVVNIVGYDTDEIVNKLMSSYEKEPGFSKTAYVNALTRMAHESEWSSSDTVDELESLGGQLLFAKAWDCIPPKVKTVADVLGGW